MSTNQIRFDEVSLMLRCEAHTLEGKVDQASLRFILGGHPPHVDAMFGIRFNESEKKTIFQHLDTSVLCQCFHEYFFHNCR